MEFNNWFKKESNIHLNLFLRLWLCKWKIHWIESMSSVLHSLLSTKRKYLLVTLSLCILSERLKIVIFRQTNNLSEILVAVQSRNDSQNMSNSRFMRCHCGCSVVVVFFFILAQIGYVLLVYILSGFTTYNVLASMRGSIYSINEQREFYRSNTNTLFHSQFRTMFPLRRGRLITWLPKTNRQMKMKVCLHCSRHAMVRCGE